jgi:hypothetical protein
MADSDIAQAPPRLNSKLLLCGVLLMGIGGVIGLTGLAIGSSAVLAAGRRWVQQMEVPPSELAKIKWAQAKAATAAGVGAWRDGQQGQQARSS